MGRRQRILIVEDDALIALEMSERLTDLGYDVIGPAHTVESAEDMIAVDKPDAALLDANLAGVSSVPLGERLVQLGVPVAFCTGYDSIKNLSARLAKAPLLTKPIGEADLSNVLSSLLG
jgi:DNA-binding response OmpR family regulator